ncbi:response regulator transcription factor [Candidatus Gracilibacteria bacterium]|nr:response regulator transcription factor [Candidatus Gracilibacteria bacterium]
MIALYIVAPTPALRAGLRALLESAELQIVGEGAGLRRVAGIDVVLVADSLPPELRELSGEGELAVVALSDELRVVASLRDLALRGWAVVSPEASADELRAAVIAAAQGMIVIPHALAERLFNPRALQDEAIDALTPREREVLDLIGQGLPNKLIAAKLQISEHTVKFHISSIFSKLGAASRTEAVSLGARQGLITL